MERGLWGTLLWPIEWAVEWVLVAFHSGFTALGLPAASGWTWALAIAGLVVVVRIILIPLFVKQIQSSRRMQLIQPELQKIQKKYKGRKDPESQQAMTQETMQLYKRTGTNPFSSCLPILMQMPIFFGLFYVLNNLGRVASGEVQSAGPLGPDLAAQAESSDIFGAVLSSTFMYSDSVSAKIVTVVLIALMSASTFITQHQLMRKNMPASALDNPFAQQQKIMLYLFPVIFAVSGVNFPIGVLIYWFTTNVWTMGQQFYVINRMPAPGSPAEQALEARRARRGKAHKKFTVPGLHHNEDDDAAGDEGTGSTAAPRDGSAVQQRPVSGQRPQPKRRKKRR
ncbi:membrane protein insertase YidC [Gephyromycinifex aptenodytis]|uniref:membrane protein insertase YidC n=1 Tax=Gephyromycinifex aptenodytis TaxID=2716227 RepID=UPI001444E3E9|nr:membrane protein insertase YidC [Gephyromycinifex aptenodytis]